MGTKFRGLLAPINAPTGDGRRFAPGSLTAAPTPFPLEWAREREMGHDGAVVVGAVQSVDISDDGVWAEGVMFDDVDRDEMPRLAEDVAEAMKLITEGTLGPSVDLDDFEAVPVKEGTDSELEGEDWDDPDLAIELLVTEGRVRAATLVSIPAFVETSRPFELIEPEGGESNDSPETARALVASVAPTLPDPSLFNIPEPDELTEITVDFETGRIFGHIAPWGTCHTGFADTCVTAPSSPREDGDYPWFHRYPVDTAEGLVWAGRITAGGRHPGLNLTASSTMSAYDGKTTAGYVRVTDGKLGIWVSGMVAPDLDESTKRTLSRRRVSGDWRETADGLSLVEVLALSPGPRMYSEPGFPVATRSHAGRQVALTASFGPTPVGEMRRPSPADFRAEVRQAVAAERERERAYAALLTAVEARQEARRIEARTELAKLVGEVNS